MDLYHSLILIGIISASMVFLDILSGETDPIAILFLPVAFFPVVGWMFGLAATVDLIVRLSKSKGKCIFRHKFDDITPQIDLKELKRVPIGCKTTYRCNRCGKERVEKESYPF